jgi:hypothetical protein
MGGPSREPRTKSRAVFILGGIVVALIVGEISRETASRFTRSVSFDVGPSTGEYLTGFTESEERPPVSFRWTRERASVELPLEGRGREREGQLEIRYARFLPGNAQVRVFEGERLSASFTARSGRFRTETIPITLGPEPVRLTFVVNDPSEERLGIAIDWIRITGCRFRLPVSVSSPRILLAGTTILAIGLGVSLWATAGIAAALAVVQAVWFALSPFAMTHAHLRVSLAALLFTSLLSVVVIVRKRTQWKWLPLLFLLSFLLKGYALFHPSHFYPDVRAHRRYVEVFRGAEGGIVERGIEAQKGAGIGYPRQIAGKGYALPYSPLFYVPLSWLEVDSRLLETVMKHVGLALASFEVVLVYVLVHSILGLGSAQWAAALTVFLPATTSRLLFAQWPTLLGHDLDIAALWMASKFLERPESSTALLRYVSVSAAAFFAYISSLIQLSVFAVVTAAVRSRYAVRVLGLVGAMALVTIGALYHPFLEVALTEIAPAVWSDAGVSLTATSEQTLWARVAGSFGRIHLFYGIGFPALGLAGLIAARRESRAFSFLQVYAITVVCLLLFRALTGGLFQDLKEILFAGPLFAATSGLALARIAERGRLGVFSAVTIAIGLAGFGMGKYFEYARMHTLLFGAG